MSETNSTERKGFRWSRLVLIVSLGFNVAIIAFIGGVATQRVPQPRPPGEFTEFLQALPQEARQALRGDIQSRGADWRAARVELRRLQQEFAALIRAEHLDIEALTDVLAKQRNLSTRIARQAHEDLIHRLAELSPTERREFLERLAHRNPRVKNTR